MTTVTDTPDGWEPDRDEARRLLRDELSDPEYAEAEPNPIMEWLRDVLTALGEWLDSLGGAAPSLPAWVLPAILVAVAVVVLVLVRPRSNAAVRARRSGAVLSGRSLTPEDHRATAQAAFAAGDHGEALAAWFRALVRQAEVRTVLDPRPGRTASEAAHALGTVFPAERQELDAAAGGFNAVVYGERRAASAQATAVRDLDARLQQASLEARGPGIRTGSGTGTGTAPSDAASVVAPR